MTEMSTQAYDALHANDLTHDCEFVRCGKGLDVKTANAIAKEIREYCGDTVDQVYGSWNETRQDYVRINRGSRAFALVCRMSA
jgi:hypothetical protein